jgi:hypothetical protein
MKRVSLGNSQFKAIYALLHEALIMLPIAELPSLGKIAMPGHEKFKIQYEKQMFLNTNTLRKG